MKQRTGRALSCVMALAFLAGHSEAQHVAGTGGRATPPHVVNGAPAEPRMFAEGVVSTPNNEFGGVFAPGGTEFYFTKSVPRSYFYMICVSRFRNGRWGAPKVAPFSGRYRDFDAVISPDGSKLFFTSDRPVDGRPKTDYDLWVMDRTSDGWGEPRNLGAPVNTESNEWFASVTAGGTLYFSSSRPGGRGIVDLYRARPAGDGYDAPEPLADFNAAGLAQTEPYVAPDESFLVFSSYDRPGGYGGWDIYVSYNRGGTWTEPRNLGPKVNTSTRDYSPRLTPDGKYLFFTSERNFATPPLRKRLTYEDLVRGVRSRLNGLGNIYQINIKALGLRR
jgi:Tol biopolymer transport system component